MTPFGRRIYAIGSNREAARLSGIAVDRYVVAVYIICSSLVVCSGIILSGYVGYVDRYLGRGFDLNSIAAAVVGGVAFSGGRGGLVAAMAGVLLVEFLSSLLLIMGMEVQAQLIVKGLVVIGAVALYSLAERRSWAFLTTAATWPRIVHQGGANSMKKAAALSALLMILSGALARAGGATSAATQKYTRAELDASPYLKSVVTREGTRADTSKFKKNGPYKIALAAQGPTNSWACLVLAFDGASLSSDSKDALWARFAMGAPQRQRRSVERYSIVKRA